MAAALPLDIRRYDPVAQTLHWLVAALAIIVITFGVLVPGMPRGTGSRDLVLMLHRSVGLALLVAMLCRIAWRLRHPPPPLPAGFSRIEALAAYADHALLYLLFVVMPLSGYVNAAAAGHKVGFAGLFVIPPLLAEDARLSQVAVAVHLAGQFFVYACVAVHVGAVLMHIVQRRHPILQRMLPPRGAR